jgi:hypothetical protein
LKTLQVNSKNGFVAENDAVIQLVTRVFSQMTNLETLVLTSLKGMTQTHTLFV